MRKAKLFSETKLSRNSLKTVFSTQLKSKILHFHVMKKNKLTVYKNYVLQFWPRRQLIILKTNLEEVQCSEKMWITFVKQTGYTIIEFSSEIEWIVINKFWKKLYKINQICLLSIMYDTIGITSFNKIICLLK